jgi:hypothetical protein
LTRSRSEPTPRRRPGAWPLERIQAAPVSPSTDLVRLPLLVGLGALLTLLLLWLTPADGLAQGLALVAVVLLAATAVGAVGPLFRLGRNEVRQAGALMQLYRELSPRRTLPRTRGWAASPDFLLTLYRTIREHRPELVVEVGSGVSTLVTAYALQQNGSGRLVSLDHDPDFAERTRHTLALHGVAGGVEVRDAPLEPTRIGDGEWQWHPQEAFQDLRAIELLVVDGPPGSAGKLARFPALPLLRTRLAPGARVLLDDGARQEERQAAERWKEEWGGEWSYVPLNKGLIVGRFNPERSRPHP